MLEALLDESRRLIQREMMFEAQRKWAELIESKGFTMLADNERLEVKYVCSTLESTSKRLFTSATDDERREYSESAVGLIDSVMPILTLSEKECLVKRHYSNQEYLCVLSHCDRAGLYRLSKRYANAARQAHNSMYLEGFFIKIMWRKVFNMNPFNIDYSAEKRELTVLLAKAKGYHCLDHVESHFHKYCLLNKSRLAIIKLKFKKANEAWRELLHSRVSLSDAQLFEAQEVVEMQIIPKGVAIEQIPLLNLAVEIVEKRIKRAGFAEIGPLFSTRWKFDAILRHHKKGLDSKRLKVDQIVYYRRRCEELRFPLLEMWDSEIRSFILQLDHSARDLPMHSQPDSIEELYFCSTSESDLFNQEKGQEVQKNGNRRPFRESTTVTLNMMAQPSSSLPLSERRFCSPH